MIERCASGLFMSNPLAYTFTDLGTAGPTVTVTFGRAWLGKNGRCEEFSIESRVTAHCKGFPAINRSSSSTMYLPIRRHSAPALPEMCGVNTMFGSQYKGD